MLSLLKLILPALMPSWDFFKQVDASPRVEWGLLDAAQTVPSVWHAFRPPPESAGPWTILRKLVWNPWWNERLFVASCVERFAAAPSDHSHAQIMARVLSDAMAHPVRQPDHAYVQFRLMFIGRDGAHLRREIIHVSERHPLGI